MQKYDFENTIGFIVNRTAKAFVKALDYELRKKVGVTFGQWKVMVMLVNQNGISQKDIADRLGLEGATLIPIIDRMEKEGLVIRKVDPADRRNNKIYRTKKADALWDKMIKCAIEIRQVSIKDIPKENINITKNVLEKIWQNLRLEFDVDCIIADNRVVNSQVNATRNIGSSSITSPRKKTRIIENQAG
jgi:MarR family transcriptional regulator for hemolysin